MLKSSSPYCLLPVASGKDTLVLLPDASPNLESLNGTIYRSFLQVTETTVGYMKLELHHSYKDLMESINSRGVNKTKDGVFWKYTSNDQCLFC